MNKESRKKLGTVLLITCWIDGHYNGTSLIQTPGTTQDVASLAYKFLDQFKYTCAIMHSVIPMLELTLYYQINEQRFLLKSQRRLLLLTS